MKDELNCSHNDRGVAYLLQSVAIHFNHTVFDTDIPGGIYACYTVRIVHFNPNRR